MKTAVGLMSGTSADGVTAVAARFGPASFEVLRLKTYPFPRTLGARLHEFLEGRGEGVPELSSLNMELGAAFARAARAISKGLRPEVIGSHGQTLWHGPEARVPNTLQLGEPSVIAEMTGLPVVADFRPRDIAAGGQGAPLVPAFEEFFFKDGPLQAFQNIGGIGNVSFVGRGRLWSAFDTGPGNALLDLACRLASGGRIVMDRGGKMAGRGRADRGWVERIIAADPYFKRPPPKSLDKGRFGETFLKAHFGAVRGMRDRRLFDLLATLSELTARSIAESLSRFAPRGGGIERVAVSGGGEANPFLMARLRDAVGALLGPVPVVSSEEVGIPPMAKEAAAFAWMALRALRGLPNNCPRATGAKGPRILGKIVWP